jgi:hypothetical protein
MKAVLVGLAVAALAGSAWSGDIYQWTDRDGGVHYGSAPPAGVSSTRMPSVAPAEHEAAATRTAPGGDAGEADAGAFSAQASLRRNALERDLRATEKRLRELDARLATLGRARTQNARGSDATGGVGAPAVDVRSEEERALAAEREQLLQHATDVRGDATKLREEVSQRLGGTPAWWNDLR